MPQDVRGEYQDWKNETMGHCPETVRGFMGRVLAVIDKYVEAEVK